MPPATDLTPGHPDQKTILRAAQLLRHGALIVFPTETVYGIAADPAQPEAMKRLYQAKGRDFNKPIAYFVSNLTQISKLIPAIPSAAEKLAAHFWPGPLTLVLPGADNVFLGFRMPDHPTPLALLQTFNHVIAVTSANQSGQPDARNAADAIATFGDQVQLYIDGGNLHGTTPSTVVKIDADNTPTILREGSIKTNELFALLNSPEST